MNTQTNTPSAENDKKTCKKKLKLKYSGTYKCMYMCVRRKNGENYEPSKHMSKTDLRQRTHARNAIRSSIVIIRNCVCVCVSVSAYTVVGNSKRVKSNKSQLKRRHSRKYT